MWSHKSGVLGLFGPEDHLLRSLLNGTDQMGRTFVYVPSPIPEAAREICRTLVSWMSGYGCSQEQITMIQLRTISTAVHGPSFRDFLKFGERDA